MKFILFKKNFCNRELVFYKNNQCLIVQIITDNDSDVEIIEDEEKASQSRVEGENLNSKTSKINEKGKQKFFVYHLVMLFLSHTQSNVICCRYI